MRDREIADPVVRDRFVEMGLPPTEELLDDLDALEPRLRRKAGVALIAFLFLDLPIVSLVWQLGAFWLATGLPSVLTFPALLLGSLLGWASWRSKASLWSLLQDRASIRSRLDARLADPAGDAGAP